MPGKKVALGDLLDSFKDFQRITYCCVNGLSLVDVDRNEIIVTGTGARSERRIRLGGLLAKAKHSIDISLSLCLGKSLPVVIISFVDGRKQGRQGDLPVMAHYRVGGCALLSSGTLRKLFLGILECGQGLGVELLNEAVGGLLSGCCNNNRGA